MRVPVPMRPRWQQTHQGWPWGASGAIHRRIENRSCCLFDILQFGVFRTSNWS